MVTDLVGGALEDPPVVLGEELLEVDNHTTVLIIIMFNSFTEEVYGYGLFLKNCIIFSFFFLILGGAYGASYGGGYGGASGTVFCLIILMF